MDDEFLYRLRKQPSRRFAAQLKAKLDRQAKPRRLLPGGGFLRGFATAAAIGALAWAVVSVPFQALFSGAEDVADGSRTASLEPAARQEPASVPIDDRKTQDAGAPSKAGTGGAAAGSAKPAPPPAPRENAPQGGPDRPGAGAAQATSAVTPLRGPRGEVEYFGADNADYLRIITSHDAYPYVRTVASDLRRGGIERLPAEDSVAAFCANIESARPSASRMRSNVLARFERADQREQSPFERGLRRDRAVCRSAMEDIVDLRVGFDAVVLARSSVYGEYGVSARDVFLALAEEVPDPSDPERLIENPYTAWAQVNSSLPNDRIEVIGPELDSPLGQSFVTMMLEYACDSLPAVAALADVDEERHRQVCRTVRDDGAYAALPMGSFEFMQRLTTYPSVMSVVSDEFFEANRATLVAASIGGVLPTAEAVAAGDYPASAGLHFYVDRRYAGVDRGLGEFLTYAVEQLPLIPLNEAERRDVRAEIESLTPTTR